MATNVKKTAKERLERPTHKFLVNINGYAVLIAAHKTDKDIVSGAFLAEEKKFDGKEISLSLSPIPEDKEYRDVRSAACMMVNGLVDSIKDQNVLRDTHQTIIKMIDNYMSRPSYDKIDLINNIRAKCKDALEYVKYFI